LIEMIGGKAAPAVGWALGVERVLELIKEHGSDVPQPVPDAYAVIPDVASLPVAMICIQALRAQGVSVQMHAPANSAEGMGSFKSQFKKADGSGARFALIFGSDELAKGQVAVKPLRQGQQGEQEVQGKQEQGAGSQQLIALTDFSALLQALK
jgi:histidyl-tRNA synthetase